MSVSGFDDVVGTDFDNSGLVNVTGDYCWINAGVRAILMTSIRNFLEPPQSTQVAVALHDILTRSQTDCTNLFQSLNLNSLPDLLPGVGDDSTRLIESSVGALIGEGVIDKALITFQLEMRALHLSLSTDVDHKVEMRVLKCLRREVTLQACIDSVFRPGKLILIQFFQ